MLSVWAVAGAEKAQKTLAVGLAWLPRCRARRTYLPRAGDRCGKPLRGRLARRNGWGQAGVAGHLLCSLREAALRPPRLGRPV